MHELSICTAIAKIAHDAAAGRTVARVRVDVGHLRQVVPDTLVHSWEMVVFESELAGAELDVRYVPAVIECRACGAHTELEHLVVRCARCDGTDTTVVSGDELMVTSLDLDEVITDA